MLSLSKHIFGKCLAYMHTDDLPGAEEMPLSQIELSPTILWLNQYFIDSEIGWERAQFYRSQKIQKNLGLQSKKTFKRVLFHNCVVNGSRVLISYTSRLLDSYVIAIASQRQEPTKWNSEFGLWLCLWAWLSDQGVRSDRIKHVWVIFKNSVFVYIENKTPCHRKMISTYLCFFPSVVFMVNTYRFCIWNLKTFRHHLPFTSLNLRHTRNLSST